MSIENIRKIEIDNDNWFVASDICKVLGLSNVTETVKKLPENFKKLHTVECFYTLNINSYKRRKTQNMNVINLEGIKIILNSSRSIYKDKLISELKLDIDIIYDFKESTFLKIICASFKNEKFILQYKIGKYRIDLYFPKYELAIEVDENNHNDRCPIYEKDRELYLKEKLNCDFIRFNPDEKYFNIGNIICLIINKIYLKSHKLI